jgi:hypothetical protein
LLFLVKKKTRAAFLYKESLQSQCHGIFTQYVSVKI